MIQRLELFLLQSARLNIAMSVSELILVLFQTSAAFLRYYFASVFLGYFRKSEAFFVVFAAIGTILPGWPTTSWLVAAGFCFGRSSRKMFQWLLTNRLFGNALLEYYKAGRALPLHSKIVIIGIISFVSACSIYVVTKLGDPGFGQATIGIVAVIGIWFVGWKVPTVQLQPQPN